MRTTIDLPDDLHRQARAIAQDSDKTLSDVVSELMRRALTAQQTSGLGKSASAGFPTIDVDRVLTTEDIRSLEDDA